MADPIRAALERLTVLARAELDAGRIPGQPAWERAMADALYALAAAPEVEPPSWCETDPEQRAWQAGREARDDVMLRRAALPPSYIDPEHQGEDLELLQTFYAACRAEGGTADEIHLRGLRAVLAARPAAPLEGESPAESLAARPLLEKVARLGDVIGQQTVAQVQQLAEQAAAWLQENPPGQPVAIEPRGCPMPGACSCVEPAAASDSIGRLCDALAQAVRPDSGYRALTSDDLKSGEEITGGAGEQIVGVEWWLPQLGCDSLQQTLDSIKGRIIFAVRDWWKTAFVTTTLVDFPAETIKPPAEGEVAELMAALRADAKCIEAGRHDLCSNTADQLTRAAELLQQRHPAPVPVSERLPGPGDCAPWPDDPDTQPWCWLGNVIDGGWEWHQRSPGILTFIRDSYTHWLPATDLPLPAVEDQP